MVGGSKDVPARITSEAMHMNNMPNLDISQTMAEHTTPWIASRARAEGINDEVRSILAQ